MLHYQIEDNILLNIRSIESYLNEGDLDLSRLTETIGSFMKCMANGRYTIEVCCRQIDVEEFNSTDELDELVSKPSILCPYKPIQLD